MATKYPENLRKADDWLTEQMIMDGAPKPAGMSQATYDNIKKYGHGANSKKATTAKKTTSKKK